MYCSAETIKSCFISCSVAYGISNASGISHIYAMPYRNKGRLGIVSVILLSKKNFTFYYVTGFTNILFVYCAILLSKKNFTYCYVIGFTNILFGYWSNLCG